MISERDIAEKFTTIWKRSFPILTPNFMRVFNEAQIEAINSNPAVTIDDDIRYDLVSEVSFNLSQIVIERSVEAVDYLSDDNNVMELLRKTAKFIWKSKNYSDDNLVLTNAETKDIVNITNNTVEFITKTKRESLQFKPTLKGYNFISDLEADLLIDDTLYEVKTVNRNFKSTDLKQLFIYLALRQVSEHGAWKWAGLYNPRKGTYCKFNVNSLIYNLSGGNTPNEAFESLLEGLVRDMELDSTF